MTSSASASKGSASPPAVPRWLIATPFDRELRASVDLACLDPLEDLGRIAPFGGMGVSGNGFLIGGQQSNLDAFTELQ